MLTVPRLGCYNDGMERYDIRPNYNGGWDVVDTGNGHGTIATFPTREMALREAIRMDKR